MKKVRLALIGVGHLGAIHLKILSELQDKAELLGVCDTHRERTQRLANHYRVPYFSDYKDLPKDIDAVDICVPTECHYEIAKHFISQGKHTFIEKPMTSTVAEADELNALAEQKGAILQVGHVERFNAAFESIKHFTEDPLFIECHRLNLFPNRSLDIGVVMDLMIHDIDIVLGIVKSPLKSVSAVGVNVLTPLEDIANARLTFENGCVCNLTASRVSDDVMRKIRIFQKETYISLDYVNQEAFIYKRHDKQILKHSLPIEKEPPLPRELDHFLTCIQNNEQPIVTGREGREALRVALEIGQEIWKTLKKTS